MQRASRITRPRRRGGTMRITMRGDRVGNRGACGHGDDGKAGSMMAMYRSRLDVRRAFRDCVSDRGGCRASWSCARASCKCASVQQGQVAPRARAREKGVRGQGHWRKGQGHLRVDVRSDRASVGPFENLRAGRKGRTERNEVSAHASGPPDESGAERTRSECRPGGPNGAQKNKTPRSSGGVCFGGGKSLARLVHGHVGAWRPARGVGRLRQVRPTVLVATG